MTRVIFPPRPKGRMNPLHLESYEKSGIWCAQRKFNGCRNLIHVLGKNVDAYTRHGDVHKAFDLDQSYKDEILCNLDLDPVKEYWLDSEVMTKTKNSRGEIVFYDVLQAGDYLFKTPNQMGRLEILKKICKYPKDLNEEGIALQISPRLLMAETFESDFQKHFEEFLHLDKIEGLVLRKKKSSLDNFGDTYYEVSWMIRCRKPNENYQH